MSTPRISIRKLREVCRLRFHTQLKFGRYSKNCGYRCSTRLGLAWLGLAGSPSRIKTKRHDTAIAVAGVCTIIPYAMLQLLLILPAVSRAVKKAKALGAPNAQSRRKALCRLCRPDAYRTNICRRVMPENAIQAPLRQQSTCLSNIKHTFTNQL